ncbi:MAG: Rpp14/Pop5 family protein [Halolamina sp.]
MKHLPKHLRPRWRYLAVDVETWAGTTLTRGDFQQATWYAAGNLLGDPASADADLTVVRFDHDAAAGEGRAVVRVRRGETDAGRAALATVTAVDGEPVGVRVRGVSGTVRACEERYLRGAPGPSYQQEIAIGGVDCQGHVRDGRVDAVLPSGPLGATDRDLDS